MPRPYVNTPPGEHCDHPGVHSYANSCPVCGMYSLHSWDSMLREDHSEWYYYREKGLEAPPHVMFWMVLEGGECSTHGAWMRRTSWHQNNPLTEWGNPSKYSTWWLVADQGYQIGK